MKKTTNVQELQSIAKQMRREIVEMITHASSGHPGGSLSAVEIVVTLFFDALRHDPSNPQWPDRDRFILSKGHAAPVLYAVMAECGYTPKDQLNTLRKLGSIYQGHLDGASFPRLKPPQALWAKAYRWASACRSPPSWTPAPRAPTWS